MITFGIPMAPICRCGYWSYAMENLKVTVRSMANQSNEAFNIVIAKTVGDIIPEFCYQYNNCNITVVDVSDSGEWSKDKDNKTLAMLKIHKQLNNKYFLRTDWDDIFHHNLVKWVTENENDNGFIITKGYFYRPQDSAVIKCDNWFMQCGSCHLVNYSKEELTEGVRHPKKFTFHHQHIHEYRQRIGKPLTQVPFRAGLYTITGKNISTPKHERILKGKVWIPASNELKNDFNL